MTLNVKKCGYVATSKSGGAVYLNGEELPRVEEHICLGFPMTGARIYFTNAVLGGN